MDHALLALCALLLNAVLAGRRWYMPPLVARWTPLPAKILRDLERKLNRENRSLREREVRGIVLVAAALVASVVVGSICGWLFSHGLYLIELILLAALLPLRWTWDVASSIRKNLALGNLAQAKKSLENTPWRHGALLDEFGLARSAIEFLAVNFSEKILAPVFWYLLLGLPGFFACRCITLMQETLVVRDEAGFGKAIILAHDVVHYVPSRLAALFWLGATCFLPTNGITAIGKHIASALIEKQPVALALLAAASSLRLSLGGPTSIYSTMWIGSGTAKASITDIKQALYLFALSTLLLLILLGLLL